MILLSPPGIAGIAILRVEPRQRDEVLACLFTPSGAVFEASAALPKRATLRFDGESIDDVLVVVRGRDLELHAHGSPAVLDQLDRRFGLTVDAPRSPAERLLREALSNEQFDLAAEQLQHDFDACLRELRAQSELERSRLFAEARARSRVARAMVEPQRVVLIGRQNAGKSTLFNRLLFRERVLTGATPGLTRDPVAEVTSLHGYPYELVDTAGEGEAGTELDRLAIDAGRAWRANSLQVLVVDGSQDVDAIDRRLAAGAVLVVRTKADLAPSQWPADMPAAISLSAENDSAAAVRQLVGERLLQHRELPPAGAVGGFAAMTDEQMLRLIDDGDCQRDSSSA